MGKKTSTRRWIVLSATVVVVGFAIWRFAGPMSAEACAQVFAKSIEQGDWPSVYDMASRRERELQSWNKKQFSLLMADISRNRVGKIGSIRIELSSNSPTRKYFHFRFEAQLPGEKANSVWIALPLYHDSDGWHPCIHGLALYMHNLHKLPKDESLQYLVAACNRTGVKGFIREDDLIEYSVERIERYLNGEMEWNRVPKYHILP